MTFLSTPGCLGSALPLKAIETDFAVDSVGVSCCLFLLTTLPGKSYAP